jgi:hypothetical protein
VARAPQQFAMLVAADFLTALFDYATHKDLIKIRVQYFLKQAEFILIPYQSRPSK